MSVVRIYIAIPTDRFEAAKDALLADDRKVYEDHSGAFSPSAAPDKVVVVAITHAFSRSAARGMHAKVRATLAQYGIPSQLLAVDPNEVVTRRFKTWHVLREPNGVGALRRPLAKVLSRRPGKMLDHSLGPLVLGTRALVAGDDTNAAARKDELAKARNEPPEAAYGRRLLLHLQGPSLPAPAPLPESPSRKRLRIALGLAMWLGGLSFTVALALYGYDPVWIFCAFLVWWAVFIGIRTWSTRIITDKQARFFAIAFSSLLALALGVIAVTLHQGIANDPDRQRNVWLALATIVIGFGLVVQFRSWRLASAVPWILPLVITAGAFLTPLVGYLTYVYYVNELSIPYSALDVSAGEQTWAGAKGMAIWAASVLILFGLTGVLQWFRGVRDDGKVMIPIYGLMALIVMLLIDATQAAKAARTINEGLPYEWYAIAPRWACFTSSDGGRTVIPAVGPQFNAAQPHVVLTGHADGTWLVWTQGEGYWQIPADRVGLISVPAGTTDCIVANPLSPTP